MKKILSFLLLLFILPVMAQSQNESDSIQLQKPFAKLKKAKGWYATDTPGKWISKDNRIYKLDHFTSYEMGMADYNGHKYLYLRKYWEMGRYAGEADGNYDMWSHNIDELIYTPKKERIKSYVYLFDIDSYKALVSNMSDGENTLEIQALLIDYKADGRDKIAADIIDDSADTLVFRTLTDKKTKAGRFLFFDTVGGDINAYSFRDIYMNNKLAYDLIGENPELFSSPELFDRYFYETSYKDLMKFLQAPLKQESK